MELYCIALHEEMKYFQKWIVQADEYEKSKVDKSYFGRPERVSVDFSQDHWMWRVLEGKEKV